MELTNSVDRSTTSA